MKYLVNKDSLKQAIYIASPKPWPCQGCEGSQLCSGTKWLHFSALPFSLPALCCHF